MMLLILQLVPKRPPCVCGVRDYAFQLARALQGLEVQSTFLAGHPAGSVVRRDGAGFVVRSLREQTAEALNEALSRSGVNILVLHYVGYGYARRGAPVWLVQGLRRWKSGASQRGLVVMFHEVWAFGPPWTSSFWLFPLQRALAAELLRLADAFLTNTGLHAARLRRLAPDRSPVAVLPVPSNIGEPNNPPLIQTREPLAVVFGQHFARERVYAHIADFMPILRAAGIEGILDIGPSVSDRAIAQCPLPVTRCGYLQPASASAAMLDARFGLVDYRLDLAAKSGIFAAYAAHGLVPLVRSTTSKEADGLRHGINLVHTCKEPMPGEAMQRLAAAAHLWYQDHAVERAALRFAQALDPAFPG
jgi:hypothetical protein